MWEQEVITTFLLSGLWT